MGVKGGERREIEGKVNEKGKEGWINGGEGEKRKVE